MKKKITIIIVSVLFSIILWGSISLSGEYYTSVTVPLMLVDFPKGYTIASPVPKTISIKLKGEGWKLFSLNLGQDVNYVVSVGKDSGSKVINLRKSLTENRWVLSDVEVIDIQPDTVTCVVERIINRRLPVSVDMKLEFKPGYGLATPAKISPDSVMVYGPVSVLNHLDYVMTKTIELSSLDRKITHQIGFVELPGTRYGRSFVDVSLDVQRIVDKQFDDISVKVLNVPPDRDVVLLPNKIAVSIRGGIEILGKLDIGQFEAFVLYRDVVLDTLGSVIPHVVIPDNTNLLYIKPERLRYVIKKYK